MAVFLQRAIASRGAERDARVHESLARHLLAAGRGREGYPLAIEAAGLLRRSGSFERSVKLLEEYAAREEDPARRLALAEETCSVLSECGDHEKGISVLEPFYRGGHGRLPRAGKVRILRRLGMHYHGADRAAEALRVFKEAQDAAEPERDLEDLLFIDSELAELHIFLGSHDAAEEACRRGLERIETASRREEVHGRMEVLLRASLGHIEMRRLRLREAREELLKALSLSRNYRMEGERAGILHNLGVTENELNRFSSARRYFAEAEKLLLKAGRQRDVIKICTNLALIEAKLGRKDEAEEELARAEEMLRHYPGQRLECFAAFSRGLVAHLYGETESAIDALEHSAALARALGDNSLRSFGLLYLSEAYLLSGRYAKALSLLNSTLKTLAEQPSPVLERMAHCRLHLTETLLGRRQRAVAAQRKLELIPRTGVLYLETWNDLLLAFCREVSGEDAAPLLEDVMGVFRRLKFVPGVRLAKLLLLGGALRREDRDAINARARGLEEEGDSPHCFLRVAEPLAAAEGRFFLGDDEKAEKWLGAASSAIVGAPFLELDGRIELMRTRLALRGGDLREARRHLHRCLHCRDLLLQFVPEEARRRFTEAPRFETLRQAIARLSISPAVEFSTERLRKSQVYEGMVGRSEAMLSLFRSLERIRDQGLSVLIAGETGTGKDLVARAIHSRSPRHERPFQSLSCACLPPELFESELFGHAAGAFTGAESDQPGILEQVEGGTLLLDQVALLPQECQAKLLRVLDSGAVRPLGSTAERRVDVRYLATASTDLRRAVEAGVFRADLYYRLAGVEIRVPPLRERKGDISLLARHFLERHAASLDRAVPVLTSDAVSLLEARDWPGNVRELETFLLRACIHLSDLEHITARYLESLGSEAREPARRRDLLTRSLEDWRRDLERDYLIQLFQKLGGNTRRMAEELHVGTTKLYSWFRDLGIDVRKLRAEGQREVQ
jgi:two-component system response regulator AtoC